MVCNLIRLQSKPYSISIGKRDAVNELQCNILAHTVAAAQTTHRDTSHCSCG